MGHMYGHGPQTMAKVLLYFVILVQLGIVHTIFLLIQARPSNNFPPSNRRTGKVPFQLIHAHLVINAHAVHAHTSHSHWKSYQAGSAGIRRRPFRFEQGQRIYISYEKFISCRSEF